MEEEADGSNKRRWPQGTTTSDGRSITSEWASLPPELVQGIADRALSTTGGGVDAYMYMRAVCPSWRSAVAKPPPLAAFADPRFRPRQWVMVDLKSESRDGDAGLFLHVPTGRFRRLRLPALRGQNVLGASDGLIVLMGRERPYLARVLDPITGDMLQFVASLDPEKHFGRGDHFYTAVSGASPPTLVLWLSSDNGLLTVVYADPTSDGFTEKYIGTWLKTMVAFQGKIYYAGPEGQVFKFVSPAEPRDRKLVVIAQMSPHMDVDIEGGSWAASHLVESAGELLLVRHLEQALKVFRVDIKRNLLEEVRSLGGCRALFVGDERCFSVDVDKYPSVGSDCVYISDMSNSWPKSSERRGRVYNLRDGTMEIIYCETMLHFRKRRLRPLSLIQQKRQSVGELLLVRYAYQSLKVFRVNIEHKLLEEVKSLGGRALFLGKERCVSVGADKLPFIDGDCIYMLDFQFMCDMCVYNLRGDMVDIISREKYLDRPFSLVQILLRYGENGYNL